MNNPMICHCDNCNANFDSSPLHHKYELPTQCPYCRKKITASHTPAVRRATDEEVKEYIEAVRASFDKLHFVQ